EREDLAPFDGEIDRVEREIARRITLGDGGDGDHRRHGGLSRGAQTGPDLFRRDGRGRRCAGRQLGLAARPRARSASVCPMSPSEIHGYEEAVDDRLVPALAVAVEDPVVAVLARKRVPGRNAVAIAVDQVIVVRYPMDLVGAKVVGVVRAAAGGLTQVGTFSPLAQTSWASAPPEARQKPRMSGKTSILAVILASPAQRIPRCSPTIAAGRNCGRR